MLDRQGKNSRLQKTGIACKTCDVSESFYSSMSIKRFRLEHLDHEVIEGSMDAPEAGPRTWQSNVREHGEDGGKVRLLKVLVELVMLPSYTTPVFTITGVKDDLKSAFVQVVSPSQRDQVKETLEKGKFLDSGSSDTVYVWEPKAISFSEGATMAMSFGPSSPVGPSPTAPNPATEEPLPSDARSTSGDVEEIQLDPTGGEQSALAVNEGAPQAEPHVLLLPPDPSDSLAQLGVSSRASAQANAVAAAARLFPEPEDSKSPSPESREVSTPGGSAGKGVATMRSNQGSRPTKVEEDDYLLVSRSFYIEGGPKNMREAVRISRLLRPFRWRVEPAYTIGVMVDDILGVETANGEIGGDMTKQIEGAGYKFSRVSVEGGKPVAWFKRSQTSNRPEVEDHSE